MNEDRDRKGKFVEGNIAAQGAVGKARKRAFIPARVMKGIEKELGELREKLEGEVKVLGARERILIDQVISQRRIAIYLDVCIKKFREVDLRVVDSQTKGAEVERRTLAALDIKHVKKLKTPMEVAAEIEARDGEEDLPEDGEKGIL